MTTVTMFLDTTDPDVLAAIAAFEGGEGVAATHVEHSGDDHLSARLARWRSVAAHLARHGVRPGPSHVQHIDGSLSPALDAFLDPHDLDGYDRDLSVEPLVALTYAVDSLDDLPVFPPGLPWVALSPQTAGLACHHPLLVALPVELHDDGRELARILANFAGNPEEEHDCVGIGGLLLGELADYASMLRRLDLRAEQVWSQLEEARSPLDPTEDNLVALGNLPAGVDLGQLVTSVGNGTGRSRWAITVLGENCD